MIDDKQRKQSSDQIQDNNKSIMHPCPEVSNCEKGLRSLWIHKKAESVQLPAGTTRQTATDSRYIPAKRLHELEVLSWTSEVR